MSLVNERKTRVRVVETYVNPEARKREVREREQERIRLETRELNRQRRAREKSFLTATADDFESVRWVSAAGCRQRKMRSGV